MDEEIVILRLAQAAAFIAIAAAVCLIIDRIFF